MNHFRKHFITKVMSVVLAAHLFNISLEAVSDDVVLRTVHQQTDHVNIMESVAELVMEVLFNWEDAIPETDDPLHEGTDSQVVNMIFMPSFAQWSVVASKSKEEQVVLLPSRYKSFNPDPSSPPPKV